MYEKKLIKISHSWYALIPAVILRMVQIDPAKDLVCISLEGNKIIIEKAKENKE